MTETLCRTCSRLRGCRILNDGHGFVWRRVSTDENPQECERWTLAGVNERNSRAALYERFGVKVIEALNNMPGPNLEDDHMPDMANPPPAPKEGIGIQERKDQLRFLTDEKGDFLLDGRGNKIIRGTYELRIYALDENGPVGAEPQQIWFKTAKELVDLIMEAEKQAGIVASKTKKAADKPAAKKESNMTRVILNRVKGKNNDAPPAQSAEVQKPLTSKTRGGNGKDEAPKDLPAETAAPAAPADLAPVISALESIAGAVAKMGKDIEAIKKQGAKDTKALTEAIAATEAKLTEGLTIFHDVYMASINQEDAGCIKDNLTIFTAYPQETEGNG